MCHLGLRGRHCGSVPWRGGNSEEGHVIEDMKGYSVEGRKRGLCSAKNY
jgi:hypothetical protein